METLEMLLAVDRLTMQRKHRVVQAIEEQRTDPDSLISEIVQVGRQVRTIFETSLFDQLDTARTYSFGRGASSARSLANERSPLNVAAIEQWSRINQSIYALRSRYSLGSPRHGFQDGRAISAALREWWRLLRREDESPLPYGVRQDFERYCRESLRILQGISGRIHAMLEPRHERELPDPCPSCSAKTYWSEGMEFSHPLVIRYDPLAQDLVGLARGYCRACETEWSARALAWDIEHPPEPIDPRLFEPIDPDTELFPPDVNPAERPDPSLYQKERLVRH